MKKILVPIDYSSYSDNAVRHAIAIAQKINADIHLCHGLEMLAFNSMAGMMMWPLEDFDEIKEDSEEDLLRYIKKLQNDSVLCAPFSPNITYSSETGSLRDIVDRLVTSFHFDLIVLGLAGAGKLDRFFLGNNSRKIIWNTIVPVLLLPKDTAYQPFKKIAIATDLRESNINSVYALAKLFCLFDPEILLVHVTDELVDMQDPKTPAKIFLNCVTSKLNYGKIYYRHINASSVEEGLEWLSDHGQVDMLTIIHRHSGIFSRILESSHTQKLATTVHIPLLVMPEDKTPISW